MTVTPGGFVALRELRRQLARYLHRTRKTTPLIQVTINDNQAIVRQTLHHPARRYALTTNAQWLFIPEGHPYPEQCILTVIKYDNPDTNTLSPFADLQT